MGNWYFFCAGLPVTGVAAVDCGLWRSMLLHGVGLGNDPLS